MLPSGSVWGGGGGLAAGAPAAGRLHVSPPPNCPPPSSAPPVEELQSDTRDVNGRSGPQARPHRPPRGRPLTGLQASVPRRELHGQAELQRQLGLPGRAAAGQLGDAVQGQAAAEEPVQHRAAQAQAPVLRGEPRLLLQQVERCGGRGRQAGPSGGAPLPGAATGPRPHGWARPPPPPQAMPGAPPSCRALSDCLLTLLPESLGLVPSSGDMARTPPTERRPGGPVAPVCPDPATVSRGSSPLPSAHGPGLDEKQRPGRAPAQAGAWAEQARPRPPAHL